MLFRPPSACATSRKNGPQGRELQGPLGYHRPANSSHGSSAGPPGLAAPAQDRANLSGTAF
eukprot:170002-Heterocapsa_arctica.AAC.1